MEKLLWKVFYFYLFVIVIKVTSDWLSIKLENIYIFNLLLFSLPVILVAIHSVVTLFFNRAVIFIFIAGLTGFIMEYIGLRDGAFFGARYIYKPQLTLLTVPVAVIIYWIVFIYTSYCLTNSFFYWLNKNKPDYKKSSRLILLLAVFLDGLILVAIDLFLDPVSVKMGSWKWLVKGPFFGIPIGNFFGWFTVSIMVTGLFRSFEYFFPSPKTKYNKTIFIIPVLYYGILTLFLASSSIKLQMYDLAILGSVLMLPTVILNLFLYKKYQLRNSK